MYWQRRYIEENRPLPGLAGLEVVDLPQKGLCSGLEFEVSALHTNPVPAGMTPDVWIHDCLTRVEVVVNGSQVVKSLSGSQILAMNHYDKTRAIETDNRNYDNNTSHEYFYINFGRWYHDEEYMLDLGRVNDPELRFFYDFTITGHDGWLNGQAFVGNPTYTVIPHILRDHEVTPAGYIKSSETYRFTSAPNRAENMTIPRGPVYCGFYLENRRYGQGFGTNVDYITLDINAGEKIPFRVSARELENEMERRYGQFIISEIIAANRAIHICPPLESCMIWESNYRNSDVIGCCGPAFGGWCMMDAHLISTYAVTAARYLRWYHFRGIHPYHLAKIPYIDPEDPRTWIATTDLGDIWIRVEETPGAGANTIIKLLSDEVVTTYL